MILIQTLSDIHALHGSSFPSTLVAYVSELFSKLCAEANHEEQAEHLLHNPIFLCESGDDLLLWFSETPFGFEYIEKLDFSGQLIYRVGILLDNDWLAQYFVPAKTLDDRTERWLTERMGLGGAANE